MKVTVILFGDLSASSRRLAGPAGAGGGPGGGRPSTSWRERLGIADEPCVVMLNDEQHHRGAELHEGDTVTFLPPIAGGYRSKGSATSPLKEGPGDLRAQRRGGRAEGERSGGAPQKESLLPPHR